MADHTQETLREAYDRLHEAALALGGLTDLLAGHTSCIDSERLFYLLHPIEIEVNTAFDCLRVVTEAYEQAGPLNTASPLIVGKGLCDGN